VQDLEGKVAVVTGGASGIGYGMVRTFLGAGMKVAVLDWSQAHLDEVKTQLKGANNVHFIKVDVTDRAAMAGAADEVERVFGKVHVLCNNAGVASGQPADEADYAEWDRVLGVNLGGVINGVKSFTPKIKAHGEGGHIVNTSSMAGLIPLPDTGGIYAASKFAVRGLTDSLRLNLAKDGIGVSTLCPGLTRSRIMATANPEGPDAPASDALFNDMSGAMDPLELGAAVVRGIQRNDPYILPHGEFRDEVREIFEEILELFPEGQDVPEARLAFERRRREITEAAKRGETPLP
jgi:NAD(P)-dependent dehydrogenase (short-subunit alcohol dehydrogenase family)